MAKFKGGNLDLKTGQQIDFADIYNVVTLGYDGTDLVVSVALKGEQATKPTHLVRFDQLTTASGYLQDQIDSITISGVGTFIALNDTPTTYSGALDNKFVFVNNDGSGLSFRYVDDYPYYAFYTYAGSNVIQEDIYTDNTMTQQISSTVVNRDFLGRITSTVKTVYDLDTGTVVVGTVTSSYQRVFGRVISETVTRT